MDNFQDNKENTIMSEPHLTHKHAHTLHQIFQHPASHNLEWRHVLALVAHSGSVQEEDKGRMTFTLNGISEVFRRSRDKDVTEVHQVLELRSFLEKAGYTKDGATGPSQHEAAQDSATGMEQHQHDHGQVNAGQNQRTDQQLKTQQNEQNERSAFREGDAQAHQQGNRQK